MEKNNISFEANVIGKGQMYSEMKKLHNDLNLKQVSMNGEVINENQLSDMIREHDIILGIFGESEKAKSVIPNKVYQSTACKKCTVTMKSDVLKEFYNEEDLITCNNNPESLANALIDLINDKTKIETISQNAYNQFNKIYFEAQANFSKYIKEIDGSLIFSFLKSEILKLLTVDPIFPTRIICSLTSGPCKTCNKYRGRTTC